VSKPSNIISTGVVIGETAVVGDDVSILHCVTLGSNGHASGDRHPKVRSGVLIGAGATLLGNIRLGDNANIGAGAVVLHDVPANHVATGKPARCTWAVKAAGSTHGEQHVFLR
jgi:serine O-acetyltransferase